MDYEKIEEASAWLIERIEGTPDVALVLGSGLGKVADTFRERSTYAYDAIPHFPTTTVSGHAGQLVYGEFAGKKAIAMQGRFHFYEGWSFQEVTFPIRIFQKLGVRNLVVTNSSGGVNHDYRPGDIVLIRDHINLTGQNPLLGRNDERFGVRFPDMSEAYDKQFRRTVMQIAEELDIPLRIGIYGGVTGPSYETPAEVRMLRTIGADVVGMSTIPEVIVASHAGMRVLGLSCVTNMAAGIIDDSRLSHEEVKEAADKASERFIRLLEASLERLDLKLEQPAKRES